jgi:Caspase domain
MMHIICKAGLAALAIALAPAASLAQATSLRGPESGEVRALVVGIDAYQNVRPLKGAAADARDVDGALRRMGVKDVTTLIDGQADRASIMREIFRLLDRSREGDLIVFSLAGHGAQEPERVRGSQPDGMDTIFLLPGFHTTGTGTQQRIIGTEFNHVIKQLEARGARVLFVADTCHGGGLTREVDPRAEEMSYRQVARYAISNDELKPISTTRDAFLTELDFTRSALLAAVDRKTKSPEVRIPGVQGWRGALSYAVARAFEGQADANQDGKITLRELFTNVRQVVYQLSDQRQNMVAQNSANRDLDTEVVFAIGGAVPSRPAIAGARPPGLQQAAVQAAPIEPVRIASRDGQAARFTGLTARDAPFDVVLPRQNPDLVWDPVSGDVLAGGDVVAYGVQLNDLPSVIDRFAAVRGLKQLGAKSPQVVRVAPNDQLHRKDARVAVEISDVAGRMLIAFNIAGDGTVQALFPTDTDSPMLAKTEYRMPVRVRAPFGADQVVAITSGQRMEALEQALKQLNGRRSAVRMLQMVQQFAPADARIGSAGLFTAP